MLSISLGTPPIFRYLMSAESGEEAVDPDAEAVDAEEEEEEEEIEYEEEEEEEEEEEPADYNVEYVEVSPLAYQTHWHFNSALDCRPLSPKPTVIDTQSARVHATLMYHLTTAKDFEPSDEEDEDEDGDDEDTGGEVGAQGQGQDLEEIATKWLSRAASSSSSSAAASKKRIAAGAADARKRKAAAQADAGTVVWRYGGAEVCRGGCVVEEHSATLSRTCFLAAYQNDISLCCVAVSIPLQVPTSQCARPGHGLRSSTSTKMRTKNWSAERSAPLSSTAVQVQRVAGGNLPVSRRHRIPCTLIFSSTYYISP